MVPWIERVPMLSINPDAATRNDVFRLAGELMEARHLLCEISEYVTPKQLEEIKKYLETE